MTSKKRQRRQDEVAESYSKHLRISGDEAVFASRADDELFVVDRAGSKSSKKRIEKQTLKTTTGKPISKTENKLVDRILSGERKRENMQMVKFREETTLCDLWNESAQANLINDNEAKKLSKYLKIAAPGQSYNPSFDDHQNILAEALALELKKQESDARTKGQMNTALSEFTQSIMIQEDENEDEEDELEIEINDEGDSVSVSAAGKIKRKQKLTRTERNKIRNRKALAFEKSLRDQQKDLLSSITNIPKILKDIRTEEQQQTMNTLLREQQLKEGSVEKGLTYDDAGCVPLSDELDGSLRKLIPKGLPIQDQVVRMRTTGDLMKRDRRSRKVRDVPHKGKRVKWVAKYKYV